MLGTRWLDYFSIFDPLQELKVARWHQKIKNKKGLKIPNTIKTIKKFLKII